jgi:pyrroloquinoline quinone biosynthesis protein B
MIRAKRRTQSSIAVTSDSLNWVLINASPDVLTQLDATPSLQPARKARDTGIRAIVLVDSQIDHTIGLFMLREGQPLEVYCTDSVQEDLSRGNPILPILGSYCGVNWHRIPVGGGSRFEIPYVYGIRFSAVSVKSKAPPFSPHRTQAVEGDNIGLLIEDSAGAALFYAPGLCSFDDAVAACLARANCILVDGTFWTDDELIRLGFSHKRGVDMGHLAQSGAGGMIEMLRRVPNARRILIHINNTNPILDEDSPERRELEREGIEVAYDGMEIVLGV